MINFSSGDGASDCSKPALSSEAPRGGYEGEQEEGAASDALRQLNQGSKTGAPQGDRESGAEEAVVAAESRDETESQSEESSKGGDRGSTKKLL